MEQRMDKEKILMGLVEHEGRWIPIEEKLKIEREKASQPAPQAPAAPAAAGAHKGGVELPPKPVIFPQTIEVKKPGEPDVDVESSYADYVEEQKKKNRLLLFGVLIIAVVAGLLISYLLLPGK
jgi:hypothetical protein